MILDSQWLALAARSESGRPHEWANIMWVIRNRRESRGYPSTYQGVITQAWQFSYFNPWRGEPDSQFVFTEAKEGYAGDHEGWDENDYERAVVCATRVLGMDRSQAPFSHKVFNFWSPRSMDPALSIPKWRWDKLWVFAMPGIHPHRFLFAETTSMPNGEPIQVVQNRLLGLTQITQPFE